MDHRAKRITDTDAWTPIFMADDEFKETSSSGGADPKSKGEPVRISLPPKPVNLPRKTGESAGINFPRKTEAGTSSASEAESGVRESETSKIVPPQVKPPVEISKPPAPPAVPKANPSSLSSMPRPPRPPLTGVSAPKPPVVPRPPALGSMPGKLSAAPLEPATFPSGEKSPEAKMGAAPQASASKQTARIQVPHQSREVLGTPLKMEAPKPAGAAPTGLSEPVPKRRDSLMTMLAIAALVAAALSLFLSYLAFSSA